MDKEQIIQMARDAGFTAQSSYVRSKIERFASAIRAATKEEDAKICDQLQSEYPAYEFSEAIRASK